MTSTYIIKGVKYSFIKTVEENDEIWLVLNGPNGEIMKTRIVDMYGEKRLARPYKKTLPDYLKTKNNNGKELTKGVYLY